MILSYNYIRLSLMSLGLMYVKFCSISIAFIFHLMRNVAYMKATCELRLHYLTQIRSFEHIHFYTFRMFSF